MQVVENRIELLTKLGDFKITEKSELASLAESLTVSNSMLLSFFLIIYSIKLMISNLFSV